MKQDQQITAKALFEAAISTGEFVVRDERYLFDLLAVVDDELEKARAALQAIKEMSDGEKDDNECNRDPMATLEKIYQIARAALEAQPEVKNALALPSWLPIADAPKDGTNVLLARYSRVYGGWMYEVGKAYDRDGTLNAPFSHFQPLPNPPE